MAWVDVKEHKTSPFIMRVCARLVTPKLYLSKRGRGRGGEEKEEKTFFRQATLVVVFWGPKGYTMRALPLPASISLRGNKKKIIL